MFGLYGGSLETKSDRLKSLYRFKIFSFNCVVSI